ncbi:tyrosine-type recombinase/integrase [Paenibacillus sinopodophylli]|uniref:tyrosine-type recombinase/integrase n=1 Tax=Paenibacillus sinopodophylli TaxID=1837342 RepID=UPI00110CF333|nr:site-specific integrase [Paenibacillus sinopodophylli]
MSKKSSQKVATIYQEEEDQLAVWKERFMEKEIHGDRSINIEQKIDKQLQRFIDFFKSLYGHDRISMVTKRDVKAWLDHLYKDGKGIGVPMAAATVNNHRAHLSLFMTWLNQQRPHLLPEDPTKGRGIRDIQLPTPDVKALTEPQLRSLINLLDRLERFYTVKGRAWRDQEAPLRKNARPKRDRAIVYLFLSSGIRREMLVNLNLEQIEPNDPDQLRAARVFKINRIKGKGRTESRKVISDKDTREALADYLDFERTLDAGEEENTLFLRAGTASSGPGRLSVRQINKMIHRIGEWHDAEQQDPDRKINPLAPHDFRHTYAVYLAIKTSGNKLVLQRELGHSNDRYLQTYTNFPDEVLEDYQQGK